MNIRIEPIQKEHLSELAELQTRAYPAFAGQSYGEVEQTRQRFVDQLKVSGVTYYGCFRDDRLAAAMRIHDFTLNFRSIMIPAGGLGGVAVGLPYKRQGIAAEIVRFFLEKCIDQKQAVALLWPFRPDFYRRVGFGYGAKVQCYRFDPASLPNSELHHRVQTLREEHLADIVACCNTYARQRHGMVEETPHSMQRYFRSASAERFYGWYHDGSLQGFIRAGYGDRADNNFLAYDLIIHDLIYTSRDALAALLGFLRSQQDQVRSVQITTVDEDFFWLADDPRDDSDAVFPQVNHRTNVDGTGIMYRVADIDLLKNSLAECEFGAGTITIGFEIQDNQVASNCLPFAIRFKDGRATVCAGEQPDVSVTTNMEYFSGMLMGAVPCSRLLEYGLLTLSDDSRAADLDSVLATSRPPMCITPF